MIRVGILGCGFMGAMHAACYRALGAQLTAMADVKFEAAQALAAQYGAVAFDSAEELIASACVDVVDICLPVDLHTSYAVAAMKAGRHVFIEKPVCLTEQEMSLLLKTEAETGVHVQVGQVLRHWREYVWLKETVDAGVYGKVCSGMFKRLSAKPRWSDWLHELGRSGGVAVEMHVHDVDYVRYLLGEPEGVQAQASRDEHGAIQHITALYSYTDGAAIMLEASWDLPSSYPFTAEFRVKLEGATVTLRGGVLTVYPNSGAAFSPELPAVYQAQNSTGGNISDLGGYYNELGYFLDGLAGKNDLSIAPLHTAADSVRLAWREVTAAGGLILCER